MARALFPSYAFGLVAAALVGTAAASQPTTTNAPTAAQGPAASASCLPEGGFNFLCGIRSPEDLANIPGSDWIVASSFSTDGTGGLYAIDPKHPALRRIYPAAEAKAEPDLKTYPACAAPPNPAHFAAIGLSIRPRADGGGWMYAVGAGDRRGIEAFKIDTPAGRPPVVTWIGCVPAPAGANLNAVAGMFPGEMVATSTFEDPLTFADSLAGKITGNVYMRLAGEPLHKVPNTALAGDNGIEVNRDHSYIFVAATGTRQVLRYERAAPMKPPVAVQLDFAVDNLRSGPNGALVVAGRVPVANCSAELRTANQSCLPEISVMAIDRAAMSLRPIARFPASPHWSSSSTALIVGDKIWLGSPSGDRIAYRTLAP